MSTTQNWHHLPLETIQKTLNTNFHAGLSASEASRRRELYGKNIFTEGRGRTAFDILAAQFKSPLVFILLAAGIVTLFSGAYLDMTVIFIALVINVAVGMLQEERARGAFRKLKSSQQKYATVIRNNERSVISAEELVVGDIIAVEGGMAVPADARLIKQAGCATNESALTGEWVEVAKEASVLPKKTAITGQVNMLWMGTLAVAGSARAVVVAIGDDTHIGALAATLADSMEHTTPLQRSIRRLATHLTYFILAALAVIFTAGILRAQPFGEIVLVAIAIAVAAMPEGLPAAVTVVLAVGMESILKKKGLIRNLLAAETLGSTTVILTDKTGTLTKAHMQVSSVVTWSSLIHEHKEEEEEGMQAAHIDPRRVLAMAIFTSDAFVEGYNDALSEWVIRGRPVERAIVLAGLESGLHQKKLVERNPLCDTIPFESKRQFASVIRFLPGSAKKRAYFTGAPEVLLRHALFVYDGGKKRKLGRKAREMLESFLEEKAGQGLRLIGVAYKDTAWDTFSKEARTDTDVLLGDIVFGGFILIHDPIRSDVPESIKEAQQAGAHIIMVTGDNENTARRVAVEVGIANVSSDVLTGSDIEKMNDEELAEALRRTRVFARILPHQKMRLAQVLKSKDEVVAMTGDGINDAPALRRADIGIALGSGTEVAKEASDMVLLNNSFSVIVDAIAEGRRVLDNLKKIVAYLLSTSFTEIVIVGAALIAGLPLPLLPAQILWTNIVTEGFMNFTFAFEPAEEDVMRRDPRSVTMKRILTGRLRSLIVILSVVTSILMIGLYLILLRLEMPIAEVRTIMFAALSASAIFYTFSLKDLSKPIWKIRFFSNTYLLAAVALSAGALLLALFVPLLQTLLSLTALTFFDISFVLMVGFVNLFTIEIVKHFYFSDRKRA